MTEKGIEFVFLDLDDTILDFHHAEAESVRETLASLGVPTLPEVIARYSEINDAQWKRLERGELTREEVKYERFAILFRELGVSADPEMARRDYEKRLATGHWFMSGADELLQALFGRYRLFIMSNGTTSVQEGRIQSAGIAPLFEDIFLSEEIGYVKPQKAFFDTAFARIKGFDPTRAVILGDSPTSDILGGIQAGICTCLYNPNRKPPHPQIRPDYEIRRLAQFPPLLERLSRNLQK